MRGRIEAGLIGIGILVSACGAAPADDGCSEIHEEVTYGTTSAALTLSTLASANGCSTAGAEALSQQILDELLCLLDGRLVPVSHPNIVPQHPRVHLYLSPAARTSLLQVAQVQRITINSALRTISEQYLLYRGCSVAANPGSSNHETGKAIDVSEYAAAATRLQNAGFVYPLQASDPVHFEGSGSDLRAQSVLAFQRLWNDNHPNDRLDEDGVAGPITLDRLASSPTTGFGTAGRCVRGGSDAGIRPDAGVTRDAGPARDAGASTDAARDTGADSAPEPAPVDASAAPDAPWSFDGGEEIPHAEPPTDTGGTGCSLHASTTTTTPLWTVAIALGIVFLRRRTRVSQGNEKKLIAPNRRGHISPNGTPSA